MASTYGSVAVAVSVATSPVGERVKSTTLSTLSHWFLDLPLHRGDMQILPGADGVLGFGLWRYPFASAALELTIVVVGAAMYWRALHSVAGDDAVMIRRAHICGASVLVAGVLTLALNVMGM